MGLSDIEIAQAAREYVEKGMSLSVPFAPVTVTVKFGTDGALILLLRQTPGTCP